MRKGCYSIIGIVMTIVLFTGCGENKEKQQVQEQEITVQETQQMQEEVYLSAEEDEEVPTIIEEYGEETPYPQLAEFLIAYYQIPEEYQSKTRYYYNYVDLNDDGVDEVFVVVVGEYTEVSFGDPALILWEEGETFGVVESFEGVHTPITISDQLTNGWHDIVYYEYGGGRKSGYRICRFNPQGGYQTELSEVAEELPSMGGMQILSNNLIDDMDQGRYMTLAPVAENK